RGAARGGGPGGPPALGSVHRHAAGGRAVEPRHAGRGAVAVPVGGVLGLLPDRVVLLVLVEPALRVRREADVVDELPSQAGAIGWMRRGEDLRTRRRAGEPERDAALGRGQPLPTPTPPPR